MLFERFRALIPRDASDSVIGEGGTGVIHLVRDELIDRIVALKLPHDSILRDPGARLDVINETRQAMELTHPNIVRIHDFHETGGLWGISMQYVRGKNLEEIRYQKAGQNRGGGRRRAILPYTVERIEVWISQLCHALSYAHEDAHMVHRDIKPRNLMVERRSDGFEKLLLTDFGITQKLRHHSLMLSRIQTDQEDNRTIGTLPYMSWEQIRGAPASILDDVYSVGATIYELLTGRPPFYEGVIEQIRHQVECTVPPSMTQRLAQFDLPHDPIPGPWEETVAACLEKRPQDRPQSIAEIMSRLGLDHERKPAKVIEKAPEAPSLEVRSLREKLKASEGELQSLRKQLSLKAAEIERIDSQLIEVNRNLAVLQASGEGEHQALEESRRVASEQLARIHELEALLAQEGSKASADQGVLGALEAELVDLKSRLDEADSDRVAADARIAELLAEADKRDAEFAEARERMTELTLEARNKDERLAALESELAEARSIQGREVETISGLEATLATLNERLVDEAARVVQLRDALDAATKREAEAVEKMAAMGARIDGITSAADEQVAEARRAMEESVAEAVEKMAAMEARVAEVSSAADEQVAEARRVMEETVAEAEKAARMKTGRALAAAMASAEAARLHAAELERRLREIDRSKVPNE